MRMINRSAAMLVLAAFFVILAGCRGNYAGKPFHFTAEPGQYQSHKNTINIKLHWNYSRPAPDTIVAEGYAEPYDKGAGVHTVQLELVGLDADGKVVNTAAGSPEDNTIVSPIDKSPFRIAMKLNGREEDFAIRGSYYFFDAGTQPGFTSRQLDFIPLSSNED